MCLLCVPAVLEDLNGLRFINSPAWKLQAFPGSLPDAIPESEYQCPTSGLQSNDQRRNWTDYQETSQWLGGIDLPRKMLEALSLGGPGQGLKFKIIDMRICASSNSNSLCFCFF